MACGPYISGDRPPDTGADTAAADTADTGPGDTSSSDDTGEPWAGEAEHRSLTEATWVLTGPNLDTRCGASVAGLGDLDQDGLAETIIGCPGADGGAGAAVIFPGGHLLVGRGYIEGLLIRSESAGAKLGAQVAGIPDLNGDGQFGMAIAAPDADDGAGVVYVVAPTDLIDGNLSTGTMPNQLLGEGGALAGASLAPAAWGGEAALLVGAPDRGRAYLAPREQLDGVLSTADALIRLGDGDAAGAAVAGRVDLDGDGLMDVAVGASGADGEAGAVAVFLASGLSEGDVALSDADALLAGEAPEDRAGAALAAAGDVDGDGLDDLVAGAPGHSTTFWEAGRAYVITSPLVDASLADAQSFDGENVRDQAGHAVSGLGDLDGDGLADVGVGAWWSDVAAYDSGEAYVILGGRVAAGGDGYLWDADLQLSGEGFGDVAGYVMAPAGDLDGDGDDEFWIGARDHDRHEGEGIFFDVGAIYGVDF